LTSSDLHRRIESLRQRLNDVPRAQADQVSCLEELSELGTAVTGAIEAEFSSSVGYTGSNAA
jgi:hypothetical protein